jgi:hypothetical protein
VCISWNNKKCFWDYRCPVQTRWFLYLFYSKSYIFIFRRFSCCFLSIVNIYLILTVNTLLILCKTFFPLLNFSCDIDKVAIHWAYAAIKPLVLNGTSHKQDQTITIYSRRDDMIRLRLSTLCRLSLSRKRIATDPRNRTDFQNACTSLYKHDWGESVYCYGFLNIFRWDRTFSENYVVFDIIFAWL